jgi:prevent-host-death family protein
MERAEDAMQATLKQLRRDTGAVVRAVGRGEHVVVTCRGRPVARMTPPDVGAKVEASELFGIWKDNEAVASVSGYVDKMRKGRHA